MAYSHSFEWLRATRLSEKINGTTINLATSSHTNATMLDLATSSYVNATMLDLATLLATINGTTMKLLKRLRLTLQPTG